jgi:hypothetical protein
LKRLWEVPRSARVRRWKGGRMGLETTRRRTETTQSLLRSHSQHHNHLVRHQSHLQLFRALDSAGSQDLPASLCPVIDQAQPSFPCNSAVELSASSSHQAMAVHLSGKMPTYQFQCNRLPFVSQFPATQIVDLLFS